MVKRLLMPALYNLSRDGLLDVGLRIVGVDHNAISDEGFAKKLEDFIRTEASSKVDHPEGQLECPTMGLAGEEHQLCAGRFSR